MSVVLAWLAWMGCAPSAGAQDDDAQARIAFQKGVEHMRAGDCDSAVRYFRIALIDKQHHQILGSLAQCELALGKNLDAFRHLERALDSVKGDADVHPAAVAELERLRADARAKLGLLRFEAVEGAMVKRVVVDGEPVADWREALLLQAGKHVVEAWGAAPSPQRVELTLLASDDKTVILDPPSPPIQAPPADTTAEARFPLWPAPLAGGLALVAAVTGAILWAEGDRTANEAIALGDEHAQKTGDDNFCFEPASAEIDNVCNEISAGLGRSDDLHNTGASFFVAGGVLALGAGALLAAHLLVDGDERVAFGVVPALDWRSGGVVVLRGSW
jgi:hypothetical protein